MRKLIIAFLDVPRLRTLALASLASLSLDVGCGGRTTPTQPKGPDPKHLARQLNADLVELSVIAKRQRGDCPKLTAELRVHVVRMKQHVDAVKSAGEDPKFAGAWRTEADAYADQKSKLTDAIAEDLAASYLGCVETNRPASTELREVIDTIPSW